MLSKCIRLDVEWLYLFSQSVEWLYLFSESELLLFKFKFFKFFFSVCKPTMLSFNCRQHSNQMWQLTFLKLLTTL